MSSELPLDRHLKLHVLTYKIGAHHRNQIYKKDSPIEVQNHHEAAYIGYNHASEAWKSLYDYGSTALVANKGISSKHHINAAVRISKLKDAIQHIDSNSPEHRKLVGIHTRLKKEFDTLDSRVNKAKLYLKKNKLLSVLHTAHHLAHHQNPDTPYKKSLFHRKKLSQYLRKTLEEHPHLVPVDTSSTFHRYLHISNYGNKKLDNNKDVVLKKRPLTSWTETHESALYFAKNYGLGARGVIVKSNATASDPAVSVNGMSSRLRAHIEPHIRAMKKHRLLSSVLHGVHSALTEMDDKLNKEKEWLRPGNGGIDRINLHHPNIKRVEGSEA